jgi:hypothetical protein
MFSKRQQLTAKCREWASLWTLLTRREPYLTSMTDYAFSSKRIWCAFPELELLIICWYFYTTSDSIRHARPNQFGRPNSTATSTRSQPRASDPGRHPMGYYVTTRHQRRRRHKLYRTTNSDYGMEKRGQTRWFRVYDSDFWWDGIWCDQKRILNGMTRRKDDLRSSEPVFNPTRQSGGTAATEFARPPGKLLRILSLPLADNVGLWTEPLPKDIPSQSKKRVIPASNLPLDLNYIPMPSP